MTVGRRTGEDIQLDFICCSDPRVRQLEERLLMGSALLLQRDECSKAIRKWLENGEKRVSKLVFLVVYSILVEEKRLQHLSDVTLVVGVIHWVCVSDRVWWPGGFGYWMLKA